MKVLLLLAIVATSAAGVIGILRDRGSAGGASEADRKPFADYPSVQGVVDTLGIPIVSQQTVVRAFGTDPQGDWFQPFGQPLRTRPGYSDIRRYATFEVDLSADAAKRWSSLFGCGPATLAIPDSIVGCPFESLDEGRWIMSIGATSGVLPNSLNALGCELGMAWDADGNRDSNYSKQSAVHDPFDQSDQINGMVLPAGGRWRLESLAFGGPEKGFTEVAPFHLGFIHKNVVGSLTPRNRFGESPRWRAFAFCTAPGDDESAVYDTIPSVEKQPESQLGVTTKVEF